MFGRSACHSRCCFQLQTKTTHATLGRSIRAKSQKTRSDNNFPLKPAKEVDLACHQRNSRRKPISTRDARSTQSRHGRNTMNTVARMPVNERLSDNYSSRGVEKRRPRSIGRSQVKIDEVVAEEIVLYKDDDIIALNKPSGVAVHSGPKVKTDLSRHLHLWQYGENHPPELAHRLDKDTSGVLLLSRHTEAARKLAQLFKDRKIIKKYWALTVGVPDQLQGLIQIPLSTKNIATKGHMNRVVLRVDKMDEFTSGVESSTGLSMAETEYQVITVASTRCCLMEVKPYTGFKHQIRVHLADGLMCPIFGDHKFAGPLYRSSPKLKQKVEAIDSVKTGSILHLHAREVVIPDYCRGKPLVITAQPPGHFIKTLKAQGLGI